MERKSSPPAWGPAALAHDAVTAFRLLTPISGQGPAPASAEAGRAALWFPVVGFTLGAALLAVDRFVVGSLPAWWRAAALVALWEFGRAAQGLTAIGRAVEDALRTTAAPRPSTALGPVALGTALGVALAKVAVVRVQGVGLPLALLFAPTLALWGVVVLATGARDSLAPGRKFNAAITFHEFAGSSVFTLAIVLGLAEAAGVAIAVSVAALLLLVRLLAHRWLGGVSWRFLLGAGQIVEIAVLAVCATL